MPNLKFALRTLFKTPFVTIVAIASLALGIGANAAIFSLFNQLLMKPLPVPEPMRLVNLAAPGPKPGSQNFLIYWDADETRELLDRTQIDKFTNANGTLTRLLTATGVASNNGTKATPALTADLFGDWREEVVWRETDSSALRIYTTTDVTTRRIYTLMHDPQYRMQVTSENTAYNQPPHPGFHIGNGMAAPPVPNISVR